MRKQLLCLLFFAGAAVMWQLRTADADTILLKTGQEISGEIVDRMNDQLKMQSQGVSVTYYIDEIESINGVSLDGNTQENKDTSAPAQNPDHETVPQVISPPPTPPTPAAVPAVVSEGDSMDILLQSVGMIGFLREKEDLIKLEPALVRLTPPAGWTKQANIQTPKGFMILHYEKEKDNPEVAITVTQDHPGDNILRAVDYTREIKSKLEEASGGKLTVNEPQDLTLSGLTASYVEMSLDGAAGKGFVAWYQFLIDRTVLTFQLMDATGRNEDTLAVFKKMAENIKVDFKK